MKNYLIDLGAGFLAGFLITFVAAIFGLMGGRLGFWPWFIILDVVIFFGYINFPLFKKRSKDKAKSLPIIISFVMFNIGVFLSGAIMAYYIVYNIDHSSGFFLM